MKRLERIAHVPHRDEHDAVHGGGAVRDETAFEADARKFGEAALRLVDRPDCAGEGHFAEAGCRTGKGLVRGGRCQGGEDRKVGSGVAEAHPAGHTGDDIHRTGVDSAPAREHSKEKVEARSLQTRGDAPRRSEVGRDCQRLDFERERAGTLDNGGHRATGGISVVTFEQG